MRRIIPVVLIVSAILSLQSCDYIRQKFQFGRYSLKEAYEWARADSARIADSVKKVIEGKKVFERTLTDSLLAVGKKSLPEGRIAPGYYIIIGTFTNHNNALKAAGKYVSQGFKTTIIPVSVDNGTTREMVSVKTFSKSDEAHEFLKGFKGIYDPDAWVYVVK